MCGHNEPGYSQDKNKKPAKQKPDFKDAEKKANDKKSEKSPA